jgi:hypothetical protein
MKPESQHTLAMKEVEASFIKTQPLIDTVEIHIQTFQHLIKSLIKYDPK